MRPRRRRPTRRPPPGAADRDRPDVAGLSGHAPVLPTEVLELLQPPPGSVVVDATAGLGGHAVLLAGQIGPAGLLVLNDLDPANLAAAQARVAALPHPPRVVARHGSFADLSGALADLGVEADAVLADLGFASTQVDDPARGLSFRSDGPLDMRYDPGNPRTAAQLVAELDERELADLIYRYGEDRLSRRIARKVVAERKTGPITSTARLAAIVSEAVGRAGRSGGIHPATRTFQALRIAVNDELGSLEVFLRSVTDAAYAVRAGQRSWLAPGARVAVIAFHSLEDRPVKHAFAALVRDGFAEGLTRKPRRPGDDEIDANPRARSARLRAIRIADGPGGASTSQARRRTSDPLYAPADRRGDDTPSPGRPDVKEDPR